MANFGNTYESPETDVELDWGTPARDWLPDIKKLYKSYKDNKYVKFFYQTDVFLLRITLTQLNEALHNEETTATMIKTIYDQLDKFGATMKSRANVRYVIAQTKTEETYSSEVLDMHNNAFLVEDDEEDGDEEDGLGE